MKEKKRYVTPQAEVFALCAEGHLLDASGTKTITGTISDMGWGDEESSGGGDAGGNEEEDGYLE